MVGDVEASFHSFRRASPHGVFVLHRQHAVEAALVQRVDKPTPVDGAEARHAVAPPADIPRVVARNGLTGPAETVSPVCENLYVLGLSVWDAVDVRAHRLHRIDAHPHEV